MKKSIISAILLLLLIITLGFYIYDAKVQRANSLLVDNSIEEIVLLNKDFDLYLKTTLSYDNFDIIQQKIIFFEYELKNINDNKILQNLKNSKLRVVLKELETTMKNKFKTINRIKSYRAILNNSFRIIQKIKNKGISNDLNNLYTIIMTVDKNPELDIRQELINIDKLIPLYPKKYEKYFLKHAQTILKYQLKFIEIELSLQKLEINNRLETLNNLYEQYSQNSIKKAQAAISILFILLAIAIVLYLIYEYRLILSNKELYKFRQTVENGDNIVVITDANEIIKYVNEAFTKTTGYTQKEIIGKKPSILKSGQQPKEFYTKLHKTIHGGKKWSGEFINKDKYGKLSYEKASITPLFDDDGEIKEFIAIKLDITKETVIGKQLKEKEKLLVQQSKMAAMGEMLENIAHQWRQPLSAISTAATGMQMQKEIDILITKEDEIETLNKINITAQHLSETINNFRDFFSSSKEKTIFNLKDTYIKTLNLINSKFKSLDIEVVENLDDIKLNTLEGEIIQVIINILNNARDILEMQENQRRLIFIDIYKDNKNAIINIRDNAGGVPENIIDKIFEPYFTTKHQSQGTGIGLYMSQEIVQKHLDGTLSVKNITYNHEYKNYTGAQFTITLPLF